MSRRLPNYLRFHRKKADLSQLQASYLLGSPNRTRISRYEGGTRMPNLRTALTLEAIYHTPIKELYAGLYEKVEREVNPRARRLAGRLERENQRAEKAVPSRKP